MKRTKRPSSEDALSPPIFSSAVYLDGEFNDKVVGNSLFRFEGWHLVKALPGPTKEHQFLKLRMVFRWAFKQLAGTNSEIAFVIENPGLGHPIFCGLTDLRALSVDAVLEELWEERYNIDLNATTFLFGRRFNHNINITSDSMPQTDQP